MQSQLQRLLEEKLLKVLNDYSTKGWFVSSIFRNR
jgi:hypothetical protein